MKVKAAAALLLVCVALCCIFPSTVKAARFTQTIHATEFEYMADEKIAALFQDAGDERRREVVLVKPPRDMKLPAGEISLSVEAPIGLVYNRRLPICISVLIDGRLYRRVLCYYMIHIYDHVLVAAHNIFPEKPLTEKDIRIEEREITKVRGRCLTEKSEAVGCVVSRMVQEGAVLSENILKEPLVITSGAPVTIVSHYNGVEVRVAGVALGRGRVGQKIRVKNVASRKVLMATVVDDSTVEIDS